MKLSIAGTTLMALGVAAFLCSTPARAQVTTMHVDIPFAFVAGDQTLPAGSYRLTVDQDFRRLRFDSRADMNVWLTRLSPATDSRSAKNAENGTLRFAHYGELYLLVNVWRPGEHDGNRVVPSKRVLETAARGNAAPTMVTVAVP